MVKEVTFTLTDELEKEIGNAIAAYGLVLRSACYGTEVPSQFENFKYLPEEDLLHRISILKQFHSDITK